MEITIYIYIYIFMCCLYVNAYIDTKMVSLFKYECIHLKARQRKYRFTHSYVHKLYYLLIGLHSFYLFSINLSIMSAANKILCIRNQKVSLPNSFPLNIYPTKSRTPIRIEIPIFHHSIIFDISLLMCQFKTRTQCQCLVRIR